MPRDLSDLMESAVSSAPPEKHHAGDITRAAERARRRRTAWVAAGAAAAVVVVAGVTVGLTQHHPTQPEPAHGPYLHDQTVDASQAVPASSLPGYRLEPWTVPSLQELGAGTSPHPTYLDVDSEGRLLVEQVTGNGAIVPSRFQLFDAPGQERPLVTPPSPGFNGSARVVWVPSFHDADHLLWSPSTAVFGAEAGFHLTDLNGDHDVFVGTHAEVGNTSYDPTPMTDHAWVSGNRILFLSYDHVANKQTGTIGYSLLSETFSGSVTKVAGDVASADVNDGVVGWTTLDGRLMLASDVGGRPHEVDVPLDPGCRVTPAVSLQNATTLRVSTRVITLTERCGRGNQTTDELLAFDPSGHLLVHVTGVSTYGVVLAGDHLLLTAVEPTGTARGDVVKYRYDLATGSLATIGAPTTSTDLQDLKGSGDYVLWYDDQGGHVASISGGG